MVTAVVASVHVEIARAALPAFKAIAKTKKLFPLAQILSEDPIVQGELARAEMSARSAEILLFHAVDDMWQTVQGNTLPTLEQRAAVRMACVNVGVSAARAADIVYKLGGSDSIFEKYPLERCFRYVRCYAAVALRDSRWPAAFFWVWRGKDLFSASLS
jgi:alkylation response protein AidB-like acyl-CoA dehydrogenase